MTARFSRRCSVSGIASSVLLLFALFFFTYFAWAAYFCKGIFDFSIFLDAARHFLDVGTLYERESNYGPGLNVYKFPPLFAALLVEAMRMGLANDDLFVLAYVLHVALYFTGVLLLSLQLHETVRHRQVFVICFSVGLLFFPLLDVNILCLQLDVYVFFLLVMVYCLFFLRWFFWAGVVLSLAVMLKIYPLVILPFFLIARRFTAVAGFLVGALLTVLYCIWSLSLEEVRWFLEHVLPILLRELPAPGAAYNVAFPALFSLVLVTIYLVHLAGTFDEQVLVAKLASGELDADAINLVINAVCATVKAFAGVLLLFMLLCIERIRCSAVRSGASLSRTLALLYGGMIAFMLTFMQNAWTNYQVHLLVPMLLVLTYCYRTPQGEVKWLRRFMGSVTVALWFFALLDTAQQHVDQFPQETVPFLFRWLAEHFSWMMVSTPWGRCAAALGILAASFLSAIQVSRQRDMSVDSL